MSAPIAPALTGSSLNASPPPVAPDRELASDVRHSVRNAVKLGASLLASWAVALAVRIVLPRQLGPALFGAFQFADAFTATIFVLASFGIETYVRKEVSARRGHASEFFGGTLVLRVALSAVVMVVAIAALAAAGKPVEVQRLVLLLGIAQILVNINGTYAALLHAAGNVDGLSVLNVASKAAWGIGIVVVLALGGGVRGVALTLLLSEVGRTIGLAVLARRHLDLRFDINLGATGAVLLASLPFYVGQLAQTANAKIDISIMAFITSDVEVGWYGAASNLAGMSMLLSPLIGWVLLPLTSRAAARSDEELTLVTRRSMEMILVAAIPVTLLLGLGADVIVRTMFGAAYAPAVNSLRIMAPMFVFTYVAIVSASVLVRLERSWMVTIISVSGMIVTPILDLYLVPRCQAAFGPGGAGIGASIVQIATELYITVWMTALLGRRAFDRRSILVVARTLGVCAVVVAVDRLLAGSTPGGWRLLADGVLYFGLAVWSGALDLRALVALVRDAGRGNGDPALAEAA